MANILGRSRQSAAALLSLLLAFAPPALPAQSPGSIDSLTARLLPPALRLAVVNASPELAAGRAMLLSAQGRRAATGFAPPAVLSMDLEEAPRGRLDKGSLRVDASREFLSPERRTAAQAAVDADIAALRVLAENAERRIVAEAARAYVQATAWQTIAARLAPQDSLLGAAEVALRARFASGDARYVDVLRLRTERLRVQTDRARVLAESRAGVVTLEALVAGDESARTANLALLARLLDAPSALFDAASLPDAPSVDVLLARSSEVRVAQAQVGRATAARRSVLAGQRPAFAASVGLQRIGPENGGFGTIGPVLGASITLPTTARAANRAATNAADLEVTAAEASVRAAAAEARRAIAEARSRYESARNRMASFDAAVLRGARDEREAALSAYRTGGLTLVELLDFERALSNAEMERTRSLIEAMLALTDLLSGRPGASVGESVSNFRVEPGIPNVER